MHRPLTILALLALAACHKSPSSAAMVLAARLPASAKVVAGLDLDQLRSTPLYAKLPENLRDASYAMFAYDGREVTTATLTGGRVMLSGPEGSGAPRELMDRAPSSPVWVVARGDASLPLAGNLANLNRLLRQTEYTILSARPADRIQLSAQGICSSAETARHLEENVRALGSMFRFPLEVDRDGSTVRVAASTTADALGKLF